jgi:hypothetical protein
MVVKAKLRFSVIGKGGMEAHKLPNFSRKSEFSDRLAVSRMAEMRSTKS